MRRARPRPTAHRAVPPRAQRSDAAKDTSHLSLRIGEGGRPEPHPRTCTFTRAEPSRSTGVFMDWNPEAGAV